MSILATAIDFCHHEIAVPGYRTLQATNVRDLVKELLKEDMIQSTS